MYTASSYNSSNFSLNEITEVVNRLEAVERQEKTIFYSSEMHKSSLEQYFNIQIDSDDFIVENLEGRFRLVEASSTLEKIGVSANAMFVVDMIWEE